jgi:hypothetical protein
VNSQKLAKFTNAKLLPAEAKKYLHQIVDKEMPERLKKYMEVELFPQIQLLVGRGISISMAHCWLHRKGFRYMQHKKALYFDGHNHPDVVDYRQNVFSPQMAEYCKRLVSYKVGDVKTPNPPQNYIERALVLLPQDESMMQSNDGPKASWVPNGEQPLKKKGVSNLLDVEGKYPGHARSQIITKD